MKWQVCIGVRAEPGYTVIGVKPRYIVTDGKTEIVMNMVFFPLWRARWRAWRLNRGAQALPSIDEVKAQRRKYDAAMAEVDRVATY